MSSPLGISYETAAVVGSRHDPHAQAREARRHPLLLHSMSQFREIFELVFKHRAIATVVEIGVESGAVSAMYTELGASAVFCVEPRPTPKLRAHLDGHDALQLVTEASPAALAQLPVADLYVLDGDHNYAVVRSELEWILTNAPGAVVVLHDLLWPCARRDQYYQPSSLPMEHRHADSDDGATIWHDELTPAGFVGLGAFRVAAEAGGERNGVLTAVEDALSVHGEWHLSLVPAVFGMGVMVRRAQESAERLTGDLRPYTGSRLLAAMENNRIALYTRILQLQYEAAVHAGEADRMADTIATQCGEIDRLNAALDASRAEQTRLEKMAGRKITSLWAASMARELSRAALSLLRTSRR